VRKAILRKRKITCRISKTRARRVFKNCSAAKRGKRKRTIKRRRKEADSSQAFSPIKISDLVKRRN